MSRHERSRGGPGGERISIQLSPTEKLKEDTFDQIRKLPKFGRQIRPHMRILRDLFDTRMGILRGNDPGEAMQGFYERHPIMRLQNPVSTALAPASRLIRDGIEALAKTRK